MPSNDPALQEWADNASAAVRRGGRARQAVIRHLARQRCCLSATEIFDGLRAEGSPVGLASIYRALEQLAALRLLLRVDLGDVARYEPALPGGDHHHHVICDDCGKVEPFSDRSARVGARRSRRSPRLRARGPRRAPPRLLRGLPRRVGAGERNRLRRLLHTNRAKGGAIRPPLRGSNTVSLLAAFGCRWAL